LTIPTTKSTTSKTTSQSTYSLMDDFTPPTVAETPTIAEGTSANQYGGGVRTGARASNQVWMFGLRILGGSNAACENALMRLDNFLRQDMHLGEEEGLTRERLRQLMNGS
jgi:hypothetical protein